MTIPSFVAATAGGTDATGAWSYTCTAAGAAGRLMILHVMQCGTSANNAVTVSSVTNIENLAGTDNVMTALAATGTGFGSAVVGYHYLFLGRSLGTSAAVITGGNSGSDDLYFRMYEFQNASTGTTLATVIENATLGAALSAAATNQTISDVGVTTLGPNRLCCQFVCNDNDNTIGPFTGETGGDWAEATAEFSSATGTDGMLSLQTANMVTAGTVDGGTVAMGGATPWSHGVLGLAIRGVSEPYYLSKAGFGAEARVA